MRKTEVGKKIVIVSMAVCTRTYKALQKYKKITIFFNGYHKSERDITVST